MGPVRSRQARTRLSAQASLTKEPPRWPRAREGRHGGGAGGRASRSRCGVEGVRVCGPRALQGAFPRQHHAVGRLAGKEMGVEGVGGWEGCKRVAPIGRSTNKSIHNKKYVPAGGGGHKKQNPVLFTYTELDRVTP